MNETAHHQIQQQNKRYHRIIRFLKNIKNINGGLKDAECFKDYFGEINIVQAYEKVMTRCMGNEIFTVNHQI